MTKVLKTFLFAILLLSHQVSYSQPPLLLDMIKANYPTDIKKRHFFADYVEIKKNYPQDTRRDSQKRLELSLYRNALERMMETEYYLSLILDDEENFRRVSSVITPLPGYPDFYRALRMQYWDWRRHMRQNGAAIRPMIMTALIGLATQLERIESEQEVVEQAIKALENPIDLKSPKNIDNQLLSDLILLSDSAAQKNNDPQLKINSREHARQELINLAYSLLQIKDGFFADWPWAMILYKPVEREGETRPLKDHLLALLEETNNEENNTDDDSETFGHLEKESRPLLEQASRQTLQQISHAIHHYRTHREKLLAHNLIREQTASYLEELQDQEALETLHQLMGKPKESISPLDVAAVGGAIGVCYLGGRLLAVPIASVVAINSGLNYFSSKASLWEGVFFGLNSLSHYEIVNSASPLFRMIKEFAIIGVSAISCTTPQGTSAIRALPATLQNFTRPGMGGRLKKILSPGNIKWHIKDKLLDLNAAPTAISSVLILAGLQAYQHGATSLFTSPDFHLTALIVSVIEFVFIFKAIQSGSSFFSERHLEAMGGVSRTIFGLTFGTQTLYSLTQKRPFDVDRLFYEATYDPLVGFTTAKIVLLYLSPPFSKFLRNRFMLNPETSIRLGMFLIMLFRNAVGNYMYLSSVNAVFNQEREDLLTEPPPEQD